MERADSWRAVEVEIRNTNVTKTFLPILTHHLLLKPGSKQGHE